MGAKQVHLYGLVAQYTGTDIKAISQKSQLSEDLGLDGVAAVHFFKAYARDFTVHIEDAWEPWRRYFGTEGFTLSSGAVVLGVLLLIDLFLLWSSPAVPRWWFAVIDAGIVAGWAAINHFRRIIVSLRLAICWLRYQRSACG